MVVLLCVSSFPLALLAGADLTFLLLTVAIAVSFSVQGFLDLGDELILQGG